jgi:hypothetical protein
MTFLFVVQVSLKICLVIAENFTGHHLNAHQFKLCSNEHDGHYLETSEQSAI